MLEAEAKKAESRGISLKDRIFIKTVTLAGMGRRIAPLINIALKNTIVKKAAEKIVGIDRKKIMNYYMNRNKLFLDHI